MPTRDRLYGVLNSIPVIPSTDENVMNSEPVPGFPGIRLARSQFGLSVLFDAERDEVPRQGETFASVRVFYAVPSEIQADGEIIEGRFTIIQLLEQDPVLESALLDLVSLFIDTESSLNAGSVQAFIKRFQRLLGEAHQVSESEILGLWGELFILAQSSDPEIAVPAWHITPTQKFDFMSGADRVEIKTTVGLRSHEFSLEQLRPNEPIESHVISIVTAHGHGPTILELVQRVAALAGNQEQAQRVIDLSIQTLGSSWLEARDACYDAELANSDIRIFDAGSIPAVGEVPTEVSGVRFHVDLTQMNSVGDFSKLSILSRAILPNEH